MQNNDYLCVYDSVKVLSILKVSGECASLGAT